MTTEHRKDSRGAVERAIGLSKRPLRFTWAELSPKDDSPRNGAVTGEEHTPVVSPQGATRPVDKKCK